MIGVLPLRKPAPFAYPGTAPGVDPTHPAARKNLRFSGVANGAGFNRIDSILNGTTTGVIAGGIDGIIGPYIKNANTTARVAFAGNPTAAPTSCTLAAIVLTGANGNAGLFICSGSALASNVPLLGKDSATNKLSLGALNGTPNLLSSIVLAPATTYFLAASYAINGSGNVNFVATNLKTGQITQATVANTFTSVAPNGTYTICGTAVGVASDQSVAAAMYSLAGLTPSEMLAWALDPWSFWYPQALDLSKMLSPPASGSINVNIAAVTGTGVASALTPSVSIALAQASGTGTVGSLVSLDIPGLVGVAGIGVAQGITPEVDAFLIGVSGTGQAGTFSFGGAGSGSLTGVSGTGVAGGITASIQAFLSGASGTGVAGVFTPTVGSTLGAAAGTGVAGSFTTTASGNVTPSQANGTGVAGDIFASISAFFAGAIGTGVAGSLAPQVAVNFAGVAGIGVAGGVAGQVTGGTLNVGVVGVAGIGVAGIITADNGVVQAVGGGNGGSRPVREKKKKQPVEFKPVPRKGTFPKGYLPEAAPEAAPASQPAPLEQVHYELPEVPLAPQPAPQLVPSSEDLAPFGAKVEEPAPEQDPEIEPSEPEAEAPQPSAEPEDDLKPVAPPLDVDALVEAGIEEARQAKARETELQEKIAAEVARQVAAAVTHLKPQIEADLLARLKAEADAKEKAEAARIAKAKDDARQLAEEIARREAEAEAEAEANEKEADRMLEAHIEQESKIRATVSAMIADIIASIQHDLT